MNNVRQIALFLVSLSLLLGCATLQVAGIERGQTVFNRINFRTYKGNKINHANLFDGGILIPVGTKCAIKHISSSSIKFIANGDKYELRDWLGADIRYEVVSKETIRAYFDKFFVENEKTIGLNEINPKFRESILSGHVEIGMTKEEVLLSVGYPAYLGLEDSSWNDDRERILTYNDWYYRSTTGSKFLIRFRAGKLYQVYSYG